MESQIRQVAIIGTGVIGASWAAFYLAQGLDVHATDIADGAESRLNQYIDAAWPALTELGLAQGADRSRLKFSTSIEEAVAGAGLIQENGPERIEFKRELYGKLDALAPPSTIIASSSSGLTMSEIQKGCRQHPERCVIGHPFNPPHLIPLVEIVGGNQTSEEVIKRAEAFYTGLGKRTIRLRKEVPGHVANRLAAALFREVVHLVAEGVVSVADADAAVSFGPGLRWGAMGPTLLYHLGGGEGGINHFFDQFTGPMSALWKVLGNPQITPEVRNAIVTGVLEEVGDRTMPQLEEQRDKILLGLLELHAKHDPQG